MTVICINDKNWNPEMSKYIKEYPVEGNTYTVVSRNHTALAGLGYVLDELNNPPLPCGTPVGFSAKRFKPIGEINIEEITEVLQEPSII